MTPPSSPPISSSIVTCGGTTTEEMNSFKLEPLVKHLRESMLHVSNSSDLEPQYKKLLDALVKMVIEEFHSLHEEKNMVVELFSRKAKMVLLSSVMGILAVSTGFLLLRMFKALIMALHPLKTLIGDSSVC
ncbi:hypothetical protein CTI12_AA473830 [Artemisia annua]|uniref:Transmembrane protein n=1 Tax=Artemisia annua TaxID=35608 RepID=A0A2U1LMY3_ARTAN|nr:hypothetical protein CTI12_AA473830 [Artemisia annua]